MSPAVVDPDRQLSDREEAKDQIRGGLVRVTGITSSLPSRAFRKGSRDRKGSCKPSPYKGRTARIDNVETEEDALRYLEGVKRRHEEGKTTRLP